MIKEKLTYLKKEFEKNNYQLNEKELKDLKKQLNRKPIQLYLLTIKILQQENEKIDYKRVSNLIILDIRIRDNLKGFLTSLEEYIRVKYIDFKKIGFADFDDFFNLSKDGLGNVIKKISKNEIYKDGIENIRYIRNRINHISYLIIFKDFDNVFNKLMEIKKLEFIDKKTFDINLKKILKTNKGLELIFIEKLFYNYKKLI